MRALSGIFTKAAYLGDSRLELEIGRRQTKSLVCTPPLAMVGDAGSPAVRERGGEQGWRDLYSARSWRLRHWSARQRPSPCANRSVTALPSLPKPGCPRTPGPTPGLACGEVARLLHTSTDAFRGRVQHQHLQQLLSRGWCYRITGPAGK